MSLKVGESKFLEWKWNRTALVKGTYMDGSCFFHSLLSVTSSKYRNMNREQQISLCKELRKSFADSLDYEKFLSLRVQDKFVSQDESYDKYIPKDQDKKDYKVRYEAYKNYLINSSQHVGAEVIHLASMELDLDIYLMRDGDIAHILVPTEVAFLKRNSVIILWNRNHYEPIGVARKDTIIKVGEDISEAYVDFVFHHSDPIIEDLYKKQKEGWDTYVEIMKEDVEGKADSKIAKSGKGNKQKKPSFRAANS